jgi:spore germination protein (amino acid permease)
MAKQAPMDNQKIGHREALTLITILISAKVFLSFPRDLALLGDAAGWIIILLAGSLSLIGFYFLNSLIHQYPSQNIIQISRQLTGNIFGTGFGIIIFVFFLILTAFMLRKFAESFILTILPRTPISLIMIVFLILLIYTVLLGIETLSRVAWFFGPYLLIALATILLFSLPMAHLDNLTPVLGPGPLPILKHSIIRSSFFAEIILLGLVAPLIRKQEKVFGIGFYSLVISILINLAVTLTMTMVFNYVASSHIIFPIFQLARLISYGEFIQRVEALFVFLWFFTAGIQLGGLFYGCVISFSETFKINEYRPLVFPLAVIILTISILPSTMTNTIVINDFVLTNFYWVIALGVPFILWLIAILFKKGRRANS